jgi:hypothetical protein
MFNSESGRHGHTYKVDTEICELRRRSRKKMISKNVPQGLWCLMLEWQARLMQLIPLGLNEQTGYELVTGRTPSFLLVVVFAWALDFAAMGEPLRRILFNFVPPPPTFFGALADSLSSNATAGWEILLEFTNGEIQWLPLKIVKESNPIELADLQ